MTTNVLLADGRKLLREGLALLLERCPDVRVVGDAADVSAAVKLVRALPVDVVLLNLPQPAAGGPAAVRALATAKRRRPPRVLVLASTADAALVRGLLEAGAAGCLAKDAAADELLAAVAAARAGHVHLSPSLVGAVIDGYVRRPSGGGGPAARRPLAPREREVLARIAAGETTKGTAAALGVSTKTVETHRRRLMEKLGRHSVAELTKYAVLEGIATLEPSG